MPTQRTVTLYLYSELSDDAKATAVEYVRGKLADWWDDGDTESVRDAMMTSLASSLGTPGDDMTVPDLTIVGWDLDRAWDLDIKGTLTRENAPSLPWVDGLNAVTIDRRQYRSAYYDWDERGAAYTSTGEYVEDALLDAVKGALHDALQDGRAEYDYITGEESARTWLDMNDNAFTFTEDGNTV